MVRIGLAEQWSILNIGDHLRRKSVEAVDVIFFCLFRNMQFPKLKKFDARKRFESDEEVVDVVVH